jgi:hypothetical protein
MAPLAAMGPPPQHDNTHHNAIPPPFEFPHTDLMGPPGTVGMDGRAHHAGTMGPPMGPLHGRLGGGMREFELAPAFDRSTVALDYEDDVTPERMMGAAARPKSPSGQRAAGLAACGLRRPCAGIRARRPSGLQSRAWAAWAPLCHPGASPSRCQTRRYPLRSSSQLILRIYCVQARSTSQSFWASRCRDMPRLCEVGSHGRVRRIALVGRCGGTLACAAADHT